MTLSRRDLLKAGALGGVAVTTGAALGGLGVRLADDDERESSAAASVTFRASHQAGIATQPPRYASFASFNVLTRREPETKALLGAWTEAAEALCTGRTVADDTGEATGMGPARLTLTFGFGASFFDDGCAPRAARPSRLIDLPAFSGDQIDSEWSGGDILVQACADDPVAVSHALRQLRRIGGGQAQLRWMQNGFLPGGPGKTPRNLFGQVDGTANPAPGSDAFEQLVWVQKGEDRDWMAAGTFMAVRRVRMNLTMWDRMGIPVQEAAVGRRRDSGAPLSGGGEFTALDLHAIDGGGNPLIASDAHVRLASVAGPGMFRRGYSFDNGPRSPEVSAATMQLPDSDQHAQHGQMDHSAMAAAMDDHDAGLMFVAFVRDPAVQFVPVQQALSAGDALGHFLINTSSGLWAIPPGAVSGAIGSGIYS